MGNELQRRIADLCRAGRFIVATDFDGTLADIEQTPAAVVLPSSAEAVLRRLTARPECILMVISGRSLADLQTRIPLQSILAGNHGLEIEGGGYHFSHPRAEALAPRLAAISTNLDALLADWPGSFLEYKGLTATVHYRQVAEARRRGLRVAVRRCVAQHGGAFGLRAGKESLELHPRVGWDKGSAVNWLREASGVSACLCIGDDRTDETMFRQCLGALTVAVGRAGFTAAEYRVQDPAAVHKVLGCVAESLDGRGISASNRLPLTVG